IVFMSLGTSFAVEAVASGVLVSRVASGRFFRRILTPVVTETSASSFSFTFMSRADAKRICSILGRDSVRATVDRSTILPLFAQAIHELDRGDDTLAEGERERETEGVDQATASLLADIYSHKYFTAPSATILDLGTGTSPKDMLCVQTTPTTYQDIPSMHRLFKQWYPQWGGAGTVEDVETLRTGPLTGIDGLESEDTPAKKGLASLTASPLPDSRPRLTRLDSLRDLPPNTPVPQPPTPVIATHTSVHTNNNTTGSGSGSGSSLDLLAPSASTSSTSSAYSHMSEVPPDALSAMSDVSNVSKAEASILAECEVEFFPMALYSKLDIVGFTSHCSTHGSDVVRMLNVLFTAFDSILDSYVGIIKVKTIGDAYELFRPFTPAQLTGGSAETIAKATADMAEATRELVQCAMRVFKIMDISLSVRAGMGIGPAMGAAVGRYGIYI
ncbi:hypothetical protein KIPB_008180, partial [Kipferlia bialata]